MTTTDDRTEAVTQLPPRGYLLPALAALQWARLAAWLLELHEDAPAARIALDRATLRVDLVPDPRAIAGELDALEQTRARWRSTDGPASPRGVALDAVKRALHACLDALDQRDDERESGVRETLQLTVRAWRLYAGIATPITAGAIDACATVLSPVVMLAAERAATEAP